VSHELELKLELPPGSMPALARVPRLLGRDRAKPQRVEVLESLYFDTPQGKLREHGVSLRIRRQGKQRLQTIKWLNRSALFDRGQAETEISGKGPDWKAIRGTALEPLASKKLRRSLKPLFKTKVRRTIYPVVTEAATIELAVDNGSIDAGRRSEPIRELELELKQGDSSELFRVARELSRAIPTRLSLKSKAERGYELRNGGAPPWVKAKEVELAAGTSVAEAFRIIARSCLAQIVGNESGVQRKNSEALHQIRIGLRRLRAAISFFSEMTAGPQTDFIKSELKWVTRELSPARDLDVYTSQVLGAFREQYKDNAEFGSLCRDFERQRADAFGRAADAVRSDRYRLLLIELAAWVEAGAWGRGDDEAARAPHGRPIELYAAAELARRRKKIMKKVKAFERLDAAQRHKLRIAVKKLRYAAEFVANVFPTKRAKNRRLALLASVKRIQDCLGALNDITVHEKLSLGVLDEQDEASPKLLRDRAFVAGLVAGQQEARAVKLTEDTAAALDDFRAVKPFWK
jgi:inorganic triphosphatase YgiF